MKEQTLEEAAKRIYPEDLMWGTDLNEDSRNAMLIGAKWQAERMYSEEEVLEILKDFRDNIPNDVYVIDWFNQFKKK